ncbi:heat shock factor protein isoform X2 [Stomoxys calcitrans]|uniref:heat shock factor protein isoform X2 n=1 Tax=Stomoxys calcitrans TaxID=35570 RepID=UPI0027E23DAB|nr:heat shock factor protein isoform X2 [Stomoxys calcitrans]
MHTFGETGAGVPAFLAKLWRLVEDPETNNLICWSKDGRSFIIQNQAQFARELLPLNYKHNNMASFIRQLNMYGFHKITSIDNGGLKFDRDEMEFTHPCFKRNCPYLLEHIKRKIASTKSVDEKSAMKPEAVSKVLQDVKAMRGRQDSLDSRFSVMKQENEALWREIASLRQKHAKQQQIVNKLIQFLITIVQPQRNNMTSVKRHMQLMINDIPDETKLRKTSESESDCGPVIHELGEELLDEVSEVEADTMAHSPFGQPSTPTATDLDAAASPQNIERPQSTISMMSQNYDYSNQSVEDALGYMAPGSNAAPPKADSLIQTVNTEGSNIFYHITEVPDAHPEASTPAPNINYNEENVLTTPMVREEMARSQLLKERNRLRRKETVADAMASSPKSSGSGNGPQPKQQRLGQQLTQAQELPQPIQIKSEQDPIDPMMFLNVYPDSNSMPADPNLISPNLSEDSRQSAPSSSTGGNFMLSNTSQRNNSLKDGNMLATGNRNDLYNPSSFIANDMPAEIFEDNSIMSAGDNSNFVADDFKMAQQQQFGLSTVNSGKFSSYMPSTSANNGTNNGSRVSTSTAGDAGGLATERPSTSKSNGNNSNNMTLAKYNSKTGAHEDVMRLSTANEVSGHLEIVQDELDTLKDLLRSDVYSLDHNTLLGSSRARTNTTTSATATNNPTSKFNIFENNNNIYLPPTLEAEILQKLFSDNDLLNAGSYGLHLPKDGNDKSGSELTAYQPMYDLSDIINEQNDLDDDSNVPSALMRPQITEAPEQRGKQRGTVPSSVLNTPYHE